MLANIRFLRHTALLGLLALAACAGLPETNYDTFRSDDSSDPQQHFTYLKEMEESLSGRPFTEGNQAHLLFNGNEAYPSMLFAIHSAKKRIDIESFLFDQKAGAKFADALLERAQHGIEVNLIYDAYGSDDTPPALFDKLRDGGVHIVQYNPMDATSVIDTSINYRDHRKLLIVDNLMAFTGGINISAVYKIHQHHRWWWTDTDDIDPAHVAWRDTQIRISGPAVTTFDDLFEETWRDQSGPPLLPITSSKKKTPQKALDEKEIVQVIDGYPAKDRFTIYQSLILAITLSQRSVHLATGYFVPPPDLLRALEDAARRGVEVVLLVPSKSDSDMALKAGRDSYSELMDAGVKIYERQGDILHEKVAVIDGIWSTVGSSNLDWRSAALNNECNAVVMGQSFGAQMEAMLQNDLRQSIKIDSKLWQDRSLLEILDDHKAALMEHFL